MKLNEVAEECHNIAVEKGFWDSPYRTFGDTIALIHSELSEALEEHRKGPLGGGFQPYFREGKPEGIAIEMADVLIRVLDYCVEAGIDIEEAVAIKMAYNRTRPRMHGKIL